MDLEDVERGEGMGCIYLAHDREKKRALVNAVMNNRSP
jgi:hypothetical protein